jgi:beta-glucosidase-like glycosyl hydrolase
VANTLRRAAAADFVLARNERAELPLVRSALKRVAFAGPNAAAARTMGGGSATVFPPYNRIASPGPASGARAGRRGRPLRWRAG